MWSSARDRAETLEVCGTVEAQVIAFVVETDTTRRTQLSVTGIVVTARDEAGVEYEYSTALRETGVGDRVLLERLCREAGEFSGEVRFLGPLVRDGS